MNAFIKASLIRAVRSFFQSLSSNLPAGLVVTPVMLQTLDISILYVIAAYLATALLHSIASVVTSIATGLPEVDNYESLQNELEGTEDPDDDGAEEEFDDD